MFKQEEIINTLNQARSVDSKYELFGASTHKYKLNPPIQASFVRYRWLFCAWNTWMSVGFRVDYSRKNAWAGV